MDCGHIICCQKAIKAAVDDSDRAGEWGEYKCDTSLKSLRSMMQFVKEDLNPDVVIWLGDSVPHNFDALSKEEIVKIMREVTSIFEEFFGTRMVYPSIGNHDTYP